MKNSLIPLLVGCFLLSPSPFQVCVLHLESPDYPELARQARIQGAVSANVKIAANGAVISATATGGHPILRAEAEKNVLTWKFAVADQHLAAPYIQTVVYEFKLEGKEVDYSPRPRVIFDLPGRVRIVTQPMLPQP